LTFGVEYEVNDNTYPRDYSKDIPFT